MRKYYLLTLLMLLFIAACGPATTDTDSGDTPAADVEDQPITSDADPFGAEVDGGAADVEELLESLPEGAPIPDSPPIPDYDPADLITTDSGLQYVILDEGDGPVPGLGDVVDVQYSGWLEDGLLFDSSVGRGLPFNFPLGAGAVIPGWDEGIALLPQGSRAILVVPSELAYGEQGSGQIPPGATLIFEVTLENITVTAKPTEVDAADYVETDSGLRYYDFNEGDGESPEDGKIVRFDYSVWLDNGVLITSSDDTGQPLTFPIGQQQMLPAVEEGVLSMQVGGKRQLVLTPEQASEGGPLQENGLILELELIDVADGAPESPQDVSDADYTEIDGGVKIYDFVVGEGPEVAEGQILVLEYTGWLADGTKFDSSIDRGIPIEIPLGTPNIIPGFNVGLAGMQVGGQRQIVIPPELGYGETGSGGIIPPNATLIFEMELLEIVEQ